MFLVIAALLQTGPAYELLAVEDARADAAPLIEALDSNDSALTLQAIRALGRFEREDLAPHVGPFLAAESPALRVEAANALAQMGTGSGILRSRLESESTLEVRSAIFEALGRLPKIEESVVLPGLAEQHPAQLGAAKGLEHLLRTRDQTPSAATIAAIRRVVREGETHPARQLALLALNGAGDRDVDTLEHAFRDPEPLVRRLAVIGLGEFRDDPSALVRYAGLKSAPSCDTAAELIDDPSEHVALLAIDTLSDGCEGAPLRDILSISGGWRRQAHALVALASVEPDHARESLSRFAEHDVWQARVYAARAAKLVQADVVLTRLRGDTHPNVVAEALVTPEDAIAALSSDHYGLLVRALGLLEGYPNGKDILPTLFDTLARVTQHGRATSRDPRRLLLARIEEFEPGPKHKLGYLLEDFDPWIAERASKLLHTMIMPRRFEPTPLPSPETLQSLVSARAHISMKEAGSFTIELLPESAPLTAAQFAKLADEGYYDGLTFHRVVANFVVQGGSPGANEYVGTDDYIRDEVGLRSHERGTLGISTRGRDTGDSQIFINLVDNYRLDHSYTVFARVVEGMENVDRIGEGDVMTSVRIERR